MMQFTIRILISIVLPIGLCIQLLADKTAFHDLGTVVQYAPLALATLLAIFRFRFDFSSPYLFAIITYVSIVLVSIAGPGEIVNLRDPLILVCSLLLLSSITTITTKDFDYLASILCIGFIISSFIKYGFPFELDFIAGKSPWEHHRLSYVFSVFVMFYFAQKRWLMFALTTVVFILSMKRIAIFGCVMGAIIWLLPDFITRSKRVRGLFLSAALLGIGMIALNIDAIINYLLQEALLSDPRLAAGRGSILMHAKVFIQENFSSPMRTLLGGGPGFSGYVAENMNQYNAYRHLHNEFLTVLVDYGIVGCLGFILIFYQFAKMSKFAFILISLQVLFSLSESAVFRYPYFLYVHIAILAMQNAAPRKVFSERYPSKSSIN